MKMAYGEDKREDGGPKSPLTKAALLKLHG